MNNPANLRLRILAALNDSMIILLPHTIFLFYLSESSNLENLIFNIIAYVILIFLPLALIIPLFYNAYLISKFGWTPGKALTGLKITDEDSKNLSYKRSFFRQTTGYGFSTLLFGLGFLSIIKDSKKQGW